MAVFRHVGLLLLSLVLVDAASLSGKDLFCRDPDTGKLHTINSTWTSTSFCGHYTCKLRKRNIPETEYSPIRVLNITNIFNKTSDDEKTQTVQREDNAVTETMQSEATTTTPPIKSTQNELEKEASESTENEKSETLHNKPTTNEIIDPIDLDTSSTAENIITVTIDERTEPETEAVTHKNDIDEAAVGLDINNVVTDKIIHKSEEKTTEVADFLSELAKTKEDRYLTEQEIKSISEILHTVKKSDLDAIVDIYNLAEDIYDEMAKTTNQGVINEAIDDMGHEELHKTLKPSYFYDPIRVPNKGRDMNFQSSNPVPTTLEPKHDIPAFFNGAMPNHDYGKLPYYYPMSLFQKSSSYIQGTQPTNIERPKPCKQKTRDMQNDQNVIKPSYLLPYPFAYIPHSNHTDHQSYPYYPPTYYYNYPWAEYNRQRMRQYQPYYNAYIAQVPAATPRAVLSNPQLTGETNLLLYPVNDNVGSKVATAKEEVIPEWKTEELSKKILDDVRANLDMTQLLKAYPLRRKVKLEKVGKLLKLENLDRFRRDADDQLKVIHKEEPLINVVGKVLAAVKQKNVTEIATEITEAKNKQGLIRGELHRMFINKLKAIVNKMEVTDKPKETPIAKDKQSIRIASTTEELGATITTEGEYETFIEKEMCETHTEPGYFRVGNLSQPYPRCCPQLIKNR